jgi:hypothetical protein
MPRHPLGERAMTAAERQARYRAARIAGTPLIRTCRPADHRGRAVAGATRLPRSPPCRPSTVLGWRPYQPTCKRAPLRRRCRQSAISTSASCRQSNRRAALARTGTGPRTTCARTARCSPHTVQARVDAGVTERNEMTIGRTEDPENPCGATARQAASVFGTGSRIPSGPAVMCRVNRCHEGQQLAA